MCVDCQSATIYHSELLSECSGPDESHETNIPACSVIRYGKYESWCSLANSTPDAVCRKNIQHPVLRRTRRFQNSSVARIQHERSSQLRNKWVRQPSFQLSTESSTRLRVSGGGGGCQFGGPAGTTPPS